MILLIVRIPGVARVSNDSVSFVGRMCLALMVAGVSGRRRIANKWRNGRMLELDEG